MNVSAFLDEMEKIAMSEGVKPEDMASILRKEAGVSSLVNLVKGTSKLHGRKLIKHLNGIKNNAKNTTKGFLNPKKSVREGWSELKKDMSKRDGDSSLNNKWTRRTAVGIGVGVDAHEIGSKEDPRGEGRSRSQRLRGVIGSQVGGLIGYKHGVTGSIIGSLAGRKLVGD